VFGFWPLLVSSAFRFVFASQKLRFSSRPLPWISAFATGFDPVEQLLPHGGLGVVARGVYRALGLFHENSGKERGRFCSHAPRLAHFFLAIFMAIFVAIFLATFLVAIFLPYPAILLFFMGKSSPFHFVRYRNAHFDESVLRVFVFGHVDHAMDPLDVVNFITFFAVDSIQRR